MDETSEISPPPGSQALPATPWDLTVTWLVRAVCVLFAAAIALALASLWPAAWTCAGVSFGLTCAVTVMGHLSCECGGRLTREYRVTREDTLVRACRDCAAGRPGSPGASECCPHGVPWSSWPCGVCTGPGQYWEA